MWRGLGFLLAAVVLSLLTIVLWQWRFEPAGSAENRIALRDGLPGADVRSPERVTVEDGVLSLEPGRHPWARVEWQLGIFPEATHLGVRAEAASHDLRHPDHPEPGKIYFYWKNRSGENEYAEDHIVLGAGGTTGWQRHEQVFELTGRMHLLCLSASTVAETGTFQLRNLEAIPLRQRPWIPWATLALCGGWAALAASCFARRSGVPRAVMAGVIWVVGAWFFVLPGPRLMITPLAGNFRYETEALAAPPPAAETPATPEKAPAAPAVQPADAETPPTPPPPSAAPAEPAAAPAKPAAEPAPPPPPAARTSGRFVEWARAVNRRFRLLHVAGMAAIGFAMFAATGTARAWLPLLALSFLSELAQVLLGYRFDTEDIGDLLLNALGISLGFAAWTRLRRRWLARGQSGKSHQSPGPRAKARC